MLRNIGKFTAFSALLLVMFTLEGTETKASIDDDGDSVDDTRCIACRAWNGAKCPRARTNDCAFAVN